jgi:hypothetical protein
MFSLPQPGTANKYLSPSSVSSDLIKNGKQEIMV